MALIRLIEYVHSDSRNARRERDNHEEGSFGSLHATSTVVEVELLQIITAACYCVVSIQIREQWLKDDFTNFFGALTAAESVRLGYGSRLDPA